MTISLHIVRSAWLWAVVWGAVFGLFVIATIQAFVKGYPTLADRLSLARSMQAFEILIGQGQHLETAAGFTSWRLMALSYIIGGIWAIRTSNGLLRGEEEAGRWELFLATRTTPRRATFDVLLGLGLALFAMWLVTFAFTLLAGRLPAAHFGTGGVFLQSWSLVSAAAMFLAVGALASQVAATAGQATMLSSAVLAIGYVVRLVGDANTSLNWVRWLSPMGWIEQLRPLQDPQLIAIVPMLVLIAICSVLTVTLAGRRDLNASVLRERDTGAGNRHLLGSSTAFAIRLGQTAGLVWLLAIALWVYLLGSLTRSATNLLSSGSPTVAATLSRLGVRQASGGYLGLIFLLTAVVVALLAATQMVAVRDEESSGRLDNLLVRPVSRIEWLAGRLGVVLGTVVLAGLAAGAFTWIGSAGQHTGVSPLKMLEAGLNVLPPALFVVGACALVFGIRPQLTAAVGYGIVAWSFLLDLVSALVKNADWLKNASLFTHMELAPAVSPDWGANAVVVLLGLAASIIGVVAFQRRDIAYA